MTKEIFDGLIGALGASSFMTMAFTMLTAESELLRPFRKWCYRNGAKVVPWYRRCPVWFGDMVQCPFCTSWWHAAWTTWLALHILQLDTVYLLLFPTAVGFTSWMYRLSARIKPTPTGNGSVQDMLKRLDD